MQMPGAVTRTRHFFTAFHFFIPTAERLALKFALFSTTKLCAIIPTAHDRLELSFELEMNKASAAYLRRFRERFQWKNCNAPPSKHAHIQRKRNVKGSSTTVLTGCPFSLPGVNRILEAAAMAASSK